MKTRNFREKYIQFKNKTTATNVVKNKERRYTNNEEKEEIELERDS
jgi:hypothetical protein